MNVYYSEVDGWIIAAIFGAVGLVLVLGAFSYYKNKIASYTCFGAGVFIVALFFLLAWPCKYTLTEDRLIIQSGIFKQEVIYSQITHVKKSSNPSSAPALSLQRVEVTMKNGFKLISPNNREKFIEELSSKKINTTL